MKTEIRSLKREGGQGVTKMHIIENLLFMSGEICCVNICLQEFSFIINSFGGAADSTPSVVGFPMYILFPTVRQFQRNLNNYAYKQDMRSENPCNFN